MLSLLAAEQSVSHRAVSFYRSAKRCAHSKSCGLLNAGPHNAKTN